MLKTFAVTLLATAISVSVANAKGRPIPKQLPYCETDQKSAKDCACGPAKTPCLKGMWCHAFTSYCSPG
jgi:hypothetical protein